MHNIFSLIKINIRHKMSQYDQAGRIVEEKNSVALINFNNFINNGEFGRSKGDKNINIINFAEKKNMLIPDTKISEYFHLVEKCRLEGVVNFYEEKQQIEASGIMIDIDRYQLKSVREFTPLQIRLLIQSTAELIRDSIDMPAEKRLTFHAFVIMKPNVIKTPEGNYKDGMHILFPDIWLSRQHKKWLFENLIAKMPHCFSDMSHDVKPVESMLDTMSASNPVFFFGHNRPGRPAYKLDSQYVLTYGGIVKDCTETKIPKGVNLSYELSLSFCLDTDEFLATKWLDKRKFEPNAQLKSQFEEIAKQAQAAVVENDENENDVSFLSYNDANARDIAKYLAILTEDYYQNYDKWFAVLCVIANTSEAYKPLALEFSKRSADKFDLTVFNEKWDEAVSSLRSTTNPLTVRSLMYWARTCDSVKYEQARNSSYCNILLTYALKYGGDIQHAMCAEVLHAMCGDKFATDVNDGDRSYRWYEFVTEGQSASQGQVWKWRKESEPDCLILFMQTTLPRAYNQVCESLKSRLAEEGLTEVETAYLKKTITAFARSTGKLYSQTYVKGVIDSCKIRFRRRGFNRLLDTTPDCIGVGNGVIKLGAKIELISRYHDYLISRHTKIRYNPIDWNNKYVIKVWEGIKKIIPEEDAREKLMIFWSNGLDLNAPLGKALLIDGCGANGKTWIMKMIHQTLSDEYAILAHPYLISGPQEQANAPNSALAALAGKTTAYIDESKQGDVINDSKLKRIVNVNNISTRDLHEKQGTFMITCNLTSVTNWKWKIESNDHGTWRRIMCYTARAKFCENPDPDNPNEHLDDEFFIKKMPYEGKYLEAMMSLLGHFYEKFKTQYGGVFSRVKSPTIDKFTEDYRSSQDDIDRFIKQYLVCVRITVAQLRAMKEADPTLVNPTEPIPLEQIADKYREWYVKQYGAAKVAKLDLTTTTEKLAQSRIIGDIKKMDDGNYLLYNHRMLNTPSDELFPNESKYGSKAPIIPTGL
jgi:phage/plasmid-associated DNA primase